MDTNRSDRPMANDTTGRGDTDGRGTDARTRDARTTGTDSIVLDAERLDVYHVALEFQGLTANLAMGGGYALRDQLERASLSCVLNIAEGAGQGSRGAKRRHYAIARGSAAECGAILDVLRVRGIVSGVEAGRARSLVVRMVQMLAKLEARWR